MQQCTGATRPDGGGLSAAGRARREKVRLQAAEWFAEGVTPPEAARRLRVSSNACRQFEHGGPGLAAAVVDAQLGVDGAVSEPERAGGLPGGADGS